MERYRNPLTCLMVGAVLTALPAFVPVNGHAETLVYKGENKWVAPEDNGPLQELMKKAQNGQTRFKAKIPADGRALAVLRLEIVMGILAREAKGAVVMEEAGVAKAGTLEIN
jgi:hypothetical protein